MRSDRGLLDGLPFIEVITSIRVRFHEVDPLGIVWHGHYLTYFEEGRVAFGRAHRLDYLDIYRAGYFAPIVKMSVDWNAPARYGDTVTVHTRFHDSEGAQLRFSYRVCDASGRVLATATSIQLFSDLAGELVLARPQFFIDFLERCRPLMRCE